MLKGIPAIIPPELMKILMEMGHSDELLLCDGNYPKAGSPERCVRMDGHGIVEILDAILRFFPLDPYVEHPAAFMEVTPGDPYVPEIWDAYREVGAKHEPAGLRESAIPRFDFYERGRTCYACVATGETALYANIILKKGVVK
jgi:L-fucose mutarotase